MTVGSIPDCYFLWENRVATFKCRFHPSMTTNSSRAVHWAQSAQLGSMRNEDSSIYTTRCVYKWVIWTPSEKEKEKNSGARRHGSTISEQFQRAKTYIELLDLSSRILYNLKARRPLYSASRNVGIPVTRFDPYSSCEKKRSYITDRRRRRRRALIYMPFIENPSAEYNNSFCKKEICFVVVAQ